MSWQGLKGTVRRQGGTGTQTLTFASGTRLLQLKATGAGTITLSDGTATGTTTITSVAGCWFDMTEHHALSVLQGSGSALQIVFTSVSAWFVEYIGPAGAS